MKEGEKLKRWTKTRLSNLVRHSESGRYYARAYSNGKEVWRELKTSHFGVAEAKLAKFLNEHREHRGDIVDTSNAKLTFAEAAQLHLQRLGHNVTIKRRTRDYYTEVLSALLKSWPTLAAMEVRKVTPASCRAWAAQYATHGSATRHNNTIAILRHVFDIALECGVIYSNPAATLKRKRIPQKQLFPPTLPKFSEFIASMQSAGSRDSRNCADLAQGLAFTGCRIGEAAEIERRDLEFETGVIVVAGTNKTERRTARFGASP